MSVMFLSCLCGSELHASRTQTGRCFLSCLCGSELASPQMIAARNGVDVEDVIASIAAFEAMVANAGVTLVDFANSASQAPAVNHGQTATGMP